MTPWSANALMCDQNSRAMVTGSTPEVGSSRNSSGGSCSRAQASDKALAQAERQDSAF